MTTEILAYHNISNNRQDAWATSFSFFKKEMRWLFNKGYRGISLREFYINTKQKNIFILTFDDGYKDFFDYAMPFLNSLNFSATIFIVSELMGDISIWRRKDLRSELLDWDEINEMVKAGYEIGSHGLYHSNLFNLTKRALKQEITGSKKLIEEKIGIPVVSFSFPWNRCNKQILNIVKKAGYKYAAITKKGCKNKFKTDCFQLCRRSMYKRKSVRGFIK